MALILSIDTSTDVCGAALLDEDQLLAETIINRPRVHAEELTSVMAAVAENGRADLAELDALAVSAGPGSYTGLRIGTSAAKGLAYVHELPLIAVPSLEVIAAEAAVCAEADDTICVVREARRDEAYAALFRVRPDTAHAAGIEAVTAPAVTVLDELPALLDDATSGRLRLAGDAARRAAEVLDVPTAVFAGGRPSPTAYWVGRSALHRYRQEDVVDLASFEPEYLRPFRTNRRKPIFDQLPGKP